MLRAAPPTTRTGAPGSARRWGATVRQASGRLSLAPASVSGETPAGTGTSMPSANGTRSTSLTMPPQPPVRPPKP